MVEGVQEQHLCLDKPDEIMILLCGEGGFFVGNRRRTNPSLLVIQLGTAKCGAALPHCAWIERLTQVRKPQMFWQLAPTPHCSMSIHEQLGPNLNWQLSLTRFTVNAVA